MHLLDGKEQGPLSLDGFKKKHSKLLSGATTVVRGLMGFGCRKVYSKPLRCR